MYTVSLFLPLRLVWLVGRGLWIVLLVAWPQATSATRMIRC